MSKNMDERQFVAEILLNHSNHGVFDAVVAAAAKETSGLVLAVERAQHEVSEPLESMATGVFIAVDALAAATPQTSFRNESIESLLEDSRYPTMGALEDDEVNGVFKSGLARERVIMCAKCKSALLHPERVASTAELATFESVSKQAKAALAKFEEADASMESMHRDTTRGEILGSELQSAVVGEDGSVLVTRASVHTHQERKSLVGTERFVSFVFAPPDHGVMVAANALDAGLLVDGNGRRAFPALVSVHNLQGAIQSLPSTLSEKTPNLFFVADGAAALAELAALATASGRNPTLISHRL